MIRQRIPDVVVKRLVTYLMVLKDYPLDDYISSAELGRLSTVNGAQVRKDLALFGEFGKQGVGYPAKALVREISKILRADREVHIVLFGVGELGTALARYLMARRRGDPSYTFVVKALIDEDKRKIGTALGDVVIRPLSDLPAVCADESPKVGIITVPASAAQDVVEAGIAQGIRGFLNFAPVKLRVPPGVRVQQTDVTLELQELAFYV